MDLGRAIFSPIGIIVSAPGVALLPAGVFLGGWWASPRNAASSGALIAGIAWLMYTIYETRMYFWAKTVHAPIRVDLLIIVPVLYLLSIVGVVSWVIGGRRARRHFRSDP
jgi:hypothetical protein